MRTWRRSLVGLAAIVAAGTLVAGACGGDDDDADGARRDEASEDAAGSDAAETTTTAGGADDDGATGSADAPDAPDADEIGEMEFCDGFRAALRVDSTTALEGVQQLEVPDEIAEDWQVFMEFAQTSMSEAPAGESAEETAATGAAAEEATQNVLDYVGRECGYSVDAMTGEVNEDGG